MIEIIFKEETMDIREQIGNRITQARKAVGITIKSLSERTKTLSPARISNWEQGTRSPGPLEAKLLAQHLNVSASYLLCLTDNPQGELVHTSGHSHRFIPVFALCDVPQVKNLLHTGHVEKTIAVDGFNPSIASEGLFALTVEDNSMQPDFNSGDLVVVDTVLSVKPGDYVLAYLPSKKQAVLRKYGEADGCAFQLLASNPLWATLQVNDGDGIVLVGVVVEHRRFL